ncbi:unnamed protein product [Lactuca virosa]|uniref:Uncharacterized protein n=1 Tax=Lactuca virosa TaxID=75947 RepID=A0AAU9LQA8_9ASTR|nr:unnamed protein product [Lactuca virosa]
MEGEVSYVLATSTSSGTSNGNFINNDLNDAHLAQFYWRLDSTCYIYKYSHGGVSRTKCILGEVDLISIAGPIGVFLRPTQTEHFMCLVLCVSH